MDDNKLMYTIPEAAKALGLGRSTVYELIDAGALLRVKVGTRALVPADTLRAYVQRLVAAQSVTDPTSDQDAAAQHAA
jgi:excisionase family DNA binding protein